MAEELSFLECNHKLVREGKLCAVCQSIFWPSPKARTAETRTLCYACRRMVKEMRAEDKKIGNKVG